MAALTKAPAAADFLVSEANGFRSRGEDTIDTTSGGINAAVVAGTVVAEVAGALDVFDGGSTVSGAADAVGIVMYPVAADFEGSVALIQRDAEVTLADLTYNGDAADVAASLATLGIITR